MITAIVHVGAAAAVCVCRNDEAVLVDIRDAVRATMGSRAEVGALRDGVRDLLWIADRYGCDDHGGNAGA